MWAGGASPGRGPHRRQSKHESSTELEMDDSLGRWLAPCHGNGGSPILVDDKLIFNCDGAKDPFVVALNKHTGDVTWKATRKKTKASNKFSFSTPLLIDEGGRKAVVSPGSGAVCAYNPDNGKVSCVDAIMGKQYWQERLGGRVSASPITKSRFCELGIITRIHLLCYSN